MERRLAAILAADVVGYSRLMGADEAGTLKRLKTFEADVVIPSVERHGGRIVKRMGDGYLVEFASVVAAVECALAWQVATRDPLSFRIGIHVGDVMVQEGDLYGDGVNVAARLESLATAGGLCLSEDAQRQVRGKIAAEFQDLGPQQLKNIAEPVRVFQTIAKSVSAQTAPAVSKSAGWRMPRVLLAPFRSLGGQVDGKADGGTLASGLTETLAAALAHFEEFELIDPGAGQKAIADQGARGAGQKVGATYILEGSVQLASGKARIGVQLIDVASGQRIWSQTIDRDLEDVFALQDEITAFVASTMGEAVGEEQARAITGKSDGDLNAYETMVRGLQHLHRINPEDNRIAREYFEKLVALNLNHYFPVLCLCWTYAVDEMNGWPPARKDAIDHSLGLMRDLLRRHERSAHVHRLLSRLLLLAGDFDQGLAHAERCYQLNPYHSDMAMSYGLALMYSGQSDKALVYLERGFAINPYAPVYYKVYLSLIYFVVGRYDDGVQALHGVDGTVGPSRVARTANLAAMDRLTEARAEAQIILQENPNFSLERLLAGLAFKRQEDRDHFADALKRAGL